MKCAYSMSQPTSTAASFKCAIAEYEFPRSESIYSVPISQQVNDDPVQSHNERLVVFRRGGMVLRTCGGESKWDGTIEAFWASALFNFLEDCLRDGEFEKLGALGEYRALSEFESQRMLEDLLGSARSDYIAVPESPSSCVMVFNFHNLKGVVGTDSYGYFAVIWQRSK
jgi:hypothetical protein